MSRESTHCLISETIDEGEAAIFHPAALQTIRAFPPMVRNSLGKAIWELQKGAKLGMPLSKPVRSVGAGAEEMRIKDASGAFYATKYEHGILVFHAFVKRTQQTSQADINLGTRRLKEMLNAQA